MCSRITSKWLLFVLPALVFSLASCDIKQGTLGSQNRIFVVADSLFWNQVEDSVRQVFEREIYTPHTEQTFHVDRIPLSKLNDFNDRMNLVFIGRTDGQGAVDAYLKKYVPKQFRDGVAQGNYFYLFNDDMFARDQIGLIMMAANGRFFLQQLKRNKEAIYNTFETKYFARLKKTTFDRDENEKLETYLADTFGWQVRLTEDYFVALSDVKNKFVWLRRIRPNRWLSIWEKDGQADVSDQGFVAERNRMTKQYYEGDYIVEDDYALTTATLNGIQAKKMTGVWRNDSLLVGGPFRTYARYDSLRDKTYFVDLYVMAPGKLKKPFLDQLEVLANTFVITDQAGGR